MTFELGGKRVMLQGDPSLSKALVSSKSMVKTISIRERRIVVGNMPCFGLRIGERTVKLLPRPPLHLKSTKINSTAKVIAILKEDPNAKPGWTLHHGRFVLIRDGWQSLSTLLLRSAS
ncbi:unnamed protein product [Dovyalis caffra]|uniref:Uncharacterized protein n=1 Tax=Dovyalis caffra TaxID=77055 RepID=A0AAV1RHX8_9ROSI|nr:unnamed protein product [Dovyalis caffra]